jgi:hypothetical protein
MPCLPGRVPSEIRSALPAGLEGYSYKPVRLDVMVYNVGGDQYGTGTGVVQVHTVGLAMRRRTGTAGG